MAGLYEVVVRVGKARACGVRRLEFGVRGARSWGFDRNIVRVAARALIRDAAATSEASGLCEAERRSAAEAELKVYGAL